ncbi:hypothetical protein CYLTODRAFT_446846 [Cylindrobasidium torrendii FP15055 ss-10]|uniref:Uncharacterized protein n=1 Tax=Cylindrobasidium torrendii FP15055 ss-10 TaxID=1314674 RepID=A0A0D7AYU8_9AGAR|nr:hypothetical protein CYLTODRAFT_446846 [Cylindrobasidium torrendii FP15055 ss-10]
MSRKGKEPLVPALPLPSSSASSSAPTPSFQTLWAYILPALDKIMLPDSELGPDENASSVQGSETSSGRIDTGSTNADAAPGNGKVANGSVNGTAKAPAIDMQLYAGIHSACYNYITTQSTDTHKPDANSGSDIYNQLDKYFSELARSILSGLDTPDNSAEETELLARLLPAFQRFSSGAQTVNRLLNYVNRHYVRRAIDEDKGWLGMHDVMADFVRSPSAPSPLSIEEEKAARMASIAKLLGSPRSTGINLTTVTDDSPSRETLAQKYRERKVAVLATWGYDPNASDSGSSSGTAFRSTTTLAEAEAAAEAASESGRVILIGSLAHRRFRFDCVEPLLAIPKGVKKKGKKKKKNGGQGQGTEVAEDEKLAEGLAGVSLQAGGASSQAAGSSSSQAGGSSSQIGGSSTQQQDLPGPKGRLARAVKHLLEVDERPETERIRIAGELADMLRKVGVKIDHPLRKKLESFVVGS